MGGGDSALLQRKELFRCDVGARADVFQIARPFTDCGEDTPGGGIVEVVGCESEGRAATQVG